MANKVLIDQSGPLPIKVSYTPQANTKETIFLSGSGFSASDGSIIGMKLLVNGVEVTEVEFCANPKMTHLAFVPRIIQYEFPFDIKTATGQITPVTIELQPRPGTTTDTSDWYNLSILD